MNVVDFKIRHIISINKHFIYFFYKLRDWTSFMSLLLYLKYISCTCKIRETSLEKAKITLCLNNRYTMKSATRAKLLLRIFFFHHTKKENQIMLLCGEVCVCVCVSALPDAKTYRAKPLHSSSCSLYLTKCSDLYSNHDTENSHISSGWICLSDTKIEPRPEKK